MSMKEKLRQVRGAICVNRREIAHTRLEAIAGADNTYSLITIFGRGNLAIKAGAGGGGSVRHAVLPCRGAATVPQELHGGDPSDSERNRGLRGSYQLCNQKCWIPHPLQ
jgi:hypothetical protein